MGDGSKQPKASAYLSMNIDLLHVDGRFLNSLIHKDMLKG
jgi:hypothetical protein